MEVSHNINNYFHRFKAEDNKKDGDNFNNKKEAYTALEEKADWDNVDKQVSLKFLTLKWSFESLKSPRGILLPH